MEGLHILRGISKLSVQLVLGQVHGESLLTSQRGRDENVCPIFFNDSVDELLSGGSAAEQANAALELRHQRHGVLDKIPPLDRRVPHLPTCKFPINFISGRKSLVEFLHKGQVTPGVVKGSSV